MKIGIDLDGVVFDSEHLYRVYEEIFSIEDTEDRRIVDREEPKYQGRYKWTPEQKKAFDDKYVRYVSQVATFMPGFLPIYKKLREKGYEMIVITARGMHFLEMIDDTKKILEENNIVFDKYYWNVQDKSDICVQENIDIMIDDDYKVVEKLINKKVKTLYFRDAGTKKLEENEYLKEVNNWGDIYRYFSDLEK